MKIKMIKILKMIRNIFLVLLGLVVVFFIGTSIWNKVSCLNEDKALNKVGTDVNVNGTNIRVSVIGEGDKTIVLLSGLGTTSPIIDFKPIAEKLSNA